MLSRQHEQTTEFSDGWSDLPAVQLEMTEL